MGPGEHKLVPTQTHGLYKDLKHDVLTDNVDDAEELFVIAKDKLLDVNRWHLISTGPVFHLMDQYGKELGRPAHSHDLISISASDIQLLLIEEIAYDDYPDEDYETFGMRVRPLSDGPGTATSTFAIERRGRHVTAHYCTRNEMAGTGSIVTDPQWLALITGLLQADTND